MKTPLVVHIDDAPKIGWGGTDPEANNGFTQQLIGDIEAGPWIYIINILETDYTVGAHSHSEDEVILIVEGKLVIGKRTCGPGSVIFFEKETDYSFKTGPEGVRFLNIRPGPTYIRSQDGTWRNESP